MPIDARPDKITYYLNIARTIAERSPCSRRKLGAILVKNDAIVSTGYNGSIRGGLNCGIEVKCLKDIQHIPSYQGHDLCSAIHAEENAIINCARSGISTIGATLFLAPKDFASKSQRPCARCRKMIIQAGIKDCYFVDLEGKVQHEEISSWVELENQWMREIENKRPEVESEIISGSLGLIKTPCEKCHKPKWACGCEE